jgi:hypothetical protein
MTSNNYPSIRKNVNANAQQPNNCCAYSPTLNDTSYSKTATPSNASMLNSPSSKP